MAADQSTMDKIVWKAYTEPDFFAALLKNKGKTAKLREVLESKEFYLDGKTLRAVKRSLNHRRIHATPKQMMTALHKCTKPAQMKRGDSWVQW